MATRTTHTPDTTGGHVLGTWALTSASTGGVQSGSRSERLLVRCAHTTADVRGSCQGMGSSATTRPRLFGPSARPCAYEARPPLATGRRRNLARSLRPGIE